MHAGFTAQANLRNSGAFDATAVEGSGGSEDGSFNVGGGGPSRGKTRTSLLSWRSRSLKKAARNDRLPAHAMPTPGDWRKDSFGKDAKAAAALAAAADAAAPAPAGSAGAVVPAVQRCRPGDQQQVRV